MIAALQRRINGNLRKKDHVPGNELKPSWTALRLQDIMWAFRTFAFHSR
jgi:hypothetical protein